MIVYSFIPRTWEAKADISENSKSVLSIEQVPGQPELEIIPMILVILLDTL